MSVQEKGATVTGLRFALAGFVATACFDVVYVADRRGNWFDLSGHTVLVHAVIGLFAWLGSGASRSVTSATSFRSPSSFSCISASRSRAG
ncbi:MAG: hypothetical protein ACRDOH_13040 [Streptosporangiaceae bacterium]